MEAHPDHGGSASEFQRVRAAYEEITSGNGARVHSSGRDAEGGGTAAEPEQESEPEPEPEPPDPEVEYLNYDVLGDHGWSLDDEDLFEKAAEAGLDAEDYGRFTVGTRDSLLEAAEGEGFAWPYACRGGACANCAVAVTEGEMSMPVDHILPSDMLDHGIRLSCVGAPVTGRMRVVYNVKHLPDLDELRLPPRPFEQARSSD
jgi:ferredoxin